MKAKHTNYLIHHLLSLATPALMMTMFSTANAQNVNRFWDGNVTGGTGDGVSQGGAGTWNTTNTNWDPGSTLTRVAWVNANNDFANFAGTAGTVTIGSAISANRLIFGTTGYILGGTNAITMSGPAPEISTAASVTATVNSVLAGTGGFNKTGSGTLILAPASTAPPTVTLTGNNSISGAISVSAGELQGTVPTGAATYTPFGTSAITVSSGASLRLFTGSTANAITVANAITLNGATLAHQDGNFTLSGSIALTGANTITGVWAAKNLTLSGVVSGAGSINKTNTAGQATTLFLNGTNTYAGGTTITLGNVSIANGSGLGTGPLTIGSGATVFSSTVGTLAVANTAAVTLANNISLPAPGSATSYGIMKSSSGQTTGTLLDLTGVVSGGNANTTLVLNSNTGGDTTTTYRLSGNNTFAGRVQVFRGGLIVNSASSLGVASNTLELNSNNSTLGDLRFGAAITIPQGVSLLSAATISSNGFNAGISGPISGSVQLSKVGAGTLSISGANTATGASVVNAGTLQLNYSTQDNSKLADAASLTLAGGTSLDLTSTSATTHVEVVGSTTLTGPASITRSGSSANKIALGVITNAGGSLNLGGDAIATTSNALINGMLPVFIMVNGARSTTDVNGNIVAVTGYSDVNRLGGLISDGSSTNVRIVEAGTSGDVTLAASGVTTIASLLNSGTAAPTVLGIGSGNTLRLAEVGTIHAGTNGLTIAGGSLTAGQFDDTAGAVEIFNDSLVATNITSTVSNNGSGSVGFIKQGSGVVSLAGVNTFTGGVTIQQGTMALSGGAALADTVVVQLNNSAVLRLDANETIAGFNGTAASTLNLQGNALTVGDAGNYTFSGTITGTAGSLLKVGSGTVTLTGTNAHTGGLSVNAGTLAASISTTAITALGTGPLSVDAGATAQLNITNITATTPTIANTITGNGILRVNFAANTTARNTSITGLGGFSGTVRLSNAGATGDKWGVAGLTTNASVDVESGSQLFINTTPSSIAGGVRLIGTGNSENRGALRISSTLTSNITLAGDTTIGGEGGIISGSVTGSTAAATLLTLGTTNSTTGVTINGVISDGSATPLSITALNGTNTLNGASTYTGTTTVTAGTFNILGTQTGGGAVNINGTSTLNLAGAVTGSTITMAAGTTLRGEGSGGALNFSGAANLVINPATTEALTVSGALTISGTTTVSFVGGPTNSGPIRVLNFGSTTAPSANFALSGAASYRTPSFTVNATNVELNFGSASLTWTGTGGSNWNVNTTTNWNNTVPAPSTFFFGDQVTFNDSPGANQTVNLAVDVQPASITFNNSAISYTLAATTGKIIGGTGITKNGTNNVTLGGANGQNFLGAIAVNAGTLTMGSRDAFGLSSGISIASGASVNINDQTPGTVTTGGYTYTIQGTGVANAGAIHNTTAVPAGVASNAGVRTLNLAGNASIGGTSRFDIGFANTAGTGGINGNGFTLTKVGTNTIHARGPATNVNYLVNEGTLGFENVATASGTNDIVVNSPGKVAVVGTLTIPNNVTVNTGGTIAGFTTAGGVWSGNIALASGSNIEAGADFSISGTATLASSGSLNKVGGSQCAITGSLVGSGGVLNLNAGTLQIGNVGATGSITGFPTINLGNGTLFRNRLTTVNNTISSNINFANSSAEVRQHGALTTDTLTLSGTVGTSTANGILRTTFGRMVLASGASSTVNMVAIQGAPASGPGVIEVASGASLTTLYFNIGQDGSNSGILNVTGGTLTALTGGGAGNNAVRIGHWNNNSSTIPSQLNVTAGLFDASAVNLITSIGWDGYGIMTVGGGASPAIARVHGLQFDANGDSPTYNDTATMLPNGTLEVGPGGMAGASTNDYVILSGGSIRAVANSTWSARMDATAATTSFLNVNNGVVVTQSGALTGTGTVEKTGPGTLQATGGTFPGTLTSSGGVLHLGTTAWTAAAFTLRSTAGGAIQPGTPGTAAASTVNALAFNGGSPTFRASFNGGSFGDRFVVSALDGFTVESSTVLTVIPGSDLFVNDSIPLINYNGTIGGAAGFAGLSATAAGNPHYQLSLTNDDTAKVVSVVINGLDSVTWIGNVNGTWDVDTTSNWETFSNATTSKFYELDAVKFNDQGAASPVVTLSGSIRPSSLEFDAAADYTLQGDPIIGPTNLRKFNTGTLTLLNNNIYTGPVTINGGRVRVGNGGTTGALGGSGNISLGALGTLEMSRSDSQTLSRAAVGAGTIRQNGTGNLNLSASLPTNLVINAGTVTATGGGFSANRMEGNGLVTINAPGTLVIAAGAAHAFGGDNVTMTESFVINGGTLTLNQEQYFIQLTLNGGTINGTNEIRATNSATAWSVTGTTPSNVSCRVNHVGNANWNVADVTSSTATDLTISGNLTNTGTLLKTGDGTMVLSGLDNSYSGGTAVNGGVLEAASVADVTAVGRIGTGYLAIANNATFRYTGTGSETTTRNFWIDTGTQNKTIDIVSATASVTFSGTGGNINKPFTKTGSGALAIADQIVVGASVTVDAGTLTLTGANTYTGDTIVNGGVLAINGSAINDANKLTINGGKVAPTGNEVVNTLFFGATQQLAGTWGATGSGATFIDDTRFSGTGTVTVVSGPPGFVSWAALKGLDGTPGKENGISDDPEKDGINNLLEFYFDGDPLASSPAPLPVADYSDANYLKLTFKRRDDAETDITGQQVQFATNLSGWVSAAITAADFTYTSGPANGVIITVVENGTAPDDVTISIPRTYQVDGRLFGRVSVTK